MYIKYTTKDKPDKEAIARCDKAAKAFQKLLIETSKIINPKPYLTFIIWLLTRFYKRKIGANYIEYHFYLLDQN